MSTTPDLSVCYECGGYDLRRVARPSRTFRVGKGTYVVPAELAILTCQTCGTEWTDSEDAQALDAAYEAQRERPPALATKLPQNTPLGRNLVVVEHLGHDLFVCRNHAGHHYVAIWMNKVEHGDLWLFAAASPSAILLLRTGQQDIRDVFRKAEDGQVIQVVSREDSNETTPLPCEYLIAEDLPPEGKRLSPSLIPNNRRRRAGSSLATAMVLGAVAPARGPWIQRPRPETAKRSDGSHPHPNLFVAPRTHGVMQ